MIDCRWCDGEGAADWVYETNGDAIALEAYLPDELDAVVAGGAKIVRGEECEECHGTGELFVDPETGKIDVTEAIFAYEGGRLDERDTLILFARLIETSMCWSLQGSYGRMGRDLVEAGIISPEGVVQWDTYNERTVE